VDALLVILRALAERNVEAPPSYPKVFAIPKEVVYAAPVEDASIAIEVAVPGTD
jgi:hypothetical protein